MRGRGAASGGQVREAGRALVLVTSMVTFTSLTVMGALLSGKGFLWNVGRFPGVVGFSFSGLFSHASCLKLLRADFQGPEEW